MTRFVLVLAMSLTAAGAARAEPDWPFPPRVADFVAKCKAERAWCAAAIEHMHSQDIVMSGIRTHYCVPVERGADSRIDPMLAFIAAHPEAGDNTRDSLLAASRALWPCRGTRYIDLAPCGEMAERAVRNRACDGGPAGSR